MTRMPGPLRFAAVRHGLVVIVLAAAVAGYTQIAGSFADFQLAQIAIYVMAIAGLTVLTGLNGQVSLGHGALMAIGGYSAALVMQHDPNGHLPLAVVLVIATAATAVAGGIIGVAAARLRGPYLAGATLALAVGIPQLAVARQFAHTLGGEQGLTVRSPQAPSFLGSSFSLEHWLSWICAAGALVVLFLLSNLVTSRYGRTFRAVRDDEIAAALAGIHVARTQVLAFVVSAASAGLGGALLGVVTSLVAPAGFTLVLSIALLTGIVLGGLGSIVGAVWGSILVVYVPQWSTDLAHSLSFSTVMGSYFAVAFYGLVLIVVMLVFPSGLQGGIVRLWGMAASRVRRG